MNEHESGKAVVVHDKTTVQVPFRNFSAQGKREVSSMSDEEIYGFLIVFNAFEEILDPKRELKDDVKKMIDGLSSEVSVAYVNGWKVIYYTEFKKFAKAGEDDLPREFTASEDDSYHNKTTKKDMAEFILSFQPYLQVVRFTGIVSQKEFESVSKLIENEKLKFECDSPYFVPVG